MSEIHTTAKATSAEPVCTMPPPKPPCQGTSDVDPGTWDSLDIVDHMTAAALCLTCRAASTCADVGVSMRSTGTFGGLLLDQGRQVRHTAGGRAGVEGGEL